MSRIGKKAALKYGYRAPAASKGIFPVYWALELSQRVCFKAETTGL